MPQTYEALRSDESADVLRALGIRERSTGRHRREVRPRLDLSLARTERDSRERERGRERQRDTLRASNSSRKRRCSFRVIAIAANAI